jgi:hypothetical protein
LQAGWTSEFCPPAVLTLYVPPICLQAEIFRHRKRDTLYTFSCEDESLAWLSTLGQAVAVILAVEGFERVQFHDYHGCVAMMHLPPAMHPVTLYTAHNAHYAGEYDAATSVRQAYLAAMLGLAQLHELLGNVADKVNVDAARSKKEKRLHLMLI